MWRVLDIASEEEPQSKQTVNWLKRTDRRLFHSGMTIIDVEPFLSVFLDQKEKREYYETVFSCLPLLNPLLSDSTLTLRYPIPASGGKMCDNSCSAVSGRTMPFELVCVQPFFSLR